MVSKYSTTMLQLVLIILADIFSTHFASIPLNIGIDKSYFNIHSTNSNVRLNLITNNFLHVLIKLGFNSAFCNYSDVIKKVIFN